MTDLKPASLPVQGEVRASCLPSDDVAPILSHLAITKPGSSEVPIDDTTPAGQAGAACEALSAKDGVEAGSTRGNLGTSVIHGREHVSEAEKLTVVSIDHLIEECYGAAKAAGWHNDPKTGKLRTAEENDAIFPTRLMLCVSELSEAMEGHRKGLMDDKLPHRKMAEVELADTLIRICDLAGAMGYDLGGAVTEKLAYNRTRADHKMENRMATGGKRY